MIRRWSVVGLVAVVMLGVGAVLWTAQQARSQTPLAITGPNILPNNDWTQPAADNPKMPAGWTQAPNATGVQFGAYTFQPDPNCQRAGAELDPKPGCSMVLLGVGNYLKSPFVAARPGAEYRVALRALSDSNSATKLRVFFHWRDAEGVDFEVSRGAWQDVPAQNWNLVSAAQAAPATATQVAISLHPASDDRIYIDDLSMGQAGVRVNPWPNGKQAALAFSFDYETEMGGLIHSKSVADDPNAASGNARDRAQRMRAGVPEALKLFAPHNIRATFYTNGYNFLMGNPTCRKFMDDPTYGEWATTANGWLSDTWKTKPWFADDPCTTEAAAPEWYFGSQIEQLAAAGQDIQSHTFAHFAGTYVGPDDWRKDFAAWHEVAKARGVAPATSLAFPWSSSAGMSYNNWNVLEQHGIRSITRTTWNGLRRSQIADREQYALRQLPGHDLAVIADEYLTPKTRDHVLQRMQTARLNEGALDVWAHTEEVTGSDQIAAWQTAIDAAVSDFWIAPVPEIAQYAQDVQRVSIDVQAEQPAYRFVVHNNSDHNLKGVTLTLPFAPDQITIDDQPATANGSTLILDLPSGATKTVVLRRNYSSLIPYPLSLSLPEAAWQA